VSALNYLIFDHSEDTEGIGTFDAMASVAPSQVALVLEEVAQVLAWAHATFPQGHGPLDEGFAWDHDLQNQQELTVSGMLLHTLTLSVSGSEAFCQAFRDRFMEAA
jgi:hypothetical protein